MHLNNSWMSISKVKCLTSSLLSIPWSTSWTHSAANEVMCVSLEVGTGGILGRQEKFSQPALAMWSWTLEQWITSQLVWDANTAGVQLFCLRENLWKMQWWVPNFPFHGIVPNAPKSLTQTYENHPFMVCISSSFFHTISKEVCNTPFTHCDTSLTIMTANRWFNTAREDLWSHNCPEYQLQSSHRSL